MDRQLGDTKWKIEDDFQARQVADNEMNSVDRSFWSRYLEEHKNPVNCMLHTIGTCLSWAMLGQAVFFQNWWLLILMPLFGYGFAWVGHDFVKRNKPLAAQFPIQSLLADYRLTLCMLLGKHPKSQPSSTATSPTNNDEATGQR